MVVLFAHFNTSEILGLIPDGESYHHQDFPLKEFFKNPGREKDQTWKRLGQLALEGQ